MAALIAEKSVKTLRQIVGKYSCGLLNHSYNTGSPHQVRGKVQRGLSGFFCRPDSKGQATSDLTNANNQSAYSEGSKESVGEVEIASAKELPPEARCLHPSDDSHAEKAEFRPA